MKKVRLVVALTICMVLILTACGSTGNSSSTDTTAAVADATEATTTDKAEAAETGDTESVAGDIDMEPTVWKAATHIESSSSHWAQQQAMFDAIYERTGGKLEIQLYNNTEFGVEAKDLLGVCEDGTVDIVFDCTSYLEGLGTVMSVIEFPMMTATNDEMQVAFDAIPDLIQADYNAMNLEYLDWWSTMGLAYFGVGECPQNLDGFKGLKVRNTQATLGDLMAHFGAVPVTMSITECLPALQRNALDAALTGCLYAHDMNWADVTDWMFVFNCGVGSNGMWVNMDSMASLPEAVQQIIREEAHNYHEASIAFNNENTQLDIDEMQEAGLEVVYCSDEDFERARDFMKDVWVEMCKGHDTYQEALDRILPALEEYRSNK